MNNTSNYINIPGYGDEHWKAPVETAFDLPNNGNDIGDVRQTTDTELFYTWSGSAWNIAGGAFGPPGPPGPPGTPGAVWFNGTGVPNNGFGVDGDYYLNDTNGDVYHKVSGSWF